MHASIEWTTYRMPAAGLGAENPLPDLAAVRDVHADIAIDWETVSAEEARYMGWARIHSILPYTLQDGYDRKKTPRDFHAAVLENDAIRATFLPEIGGRLWSLYDKRRGRELLHCNPVFQPCNLALRNAWCSGGVEWNVGIIGHTPFTCSQVITSTGALADGTPVLRMMEYERVRGLVYRVEAFLPDDSDFLFLRVCIENVADTETPVYWWSNIAVDEAEDVRVIAPATRAFQFGYGGKLAKVPMPRYNDWDVSHTTQVPHAMDFFFDLPDGQRRWISALDGGGYGLVQTSTDLLRGRKLFLWGTNPGGRNWQQFLSQPGKRYLEIQAGLAHTQLEHLPMPGGAAYDWLEAYGPCQADAQTVQGEDWEGAIHCVETTLERALPRAAMDARYADVRTELDELPMTYVQYGSAWGRLEAERCQRQGEAFHTRMNFGTLPYQAAQAPWIALLTQGALPCPNPWEEIASYQVSPAWRTMLTESIRAGKSDHWYGWYQLGVMRAWAEDRAGAAEAFQNSLAHTPSAWAMRCLAVLTLQEAPRDAALLLQRAAQLRPHRALAVEAMRALVDADLNAEAVAFADALPQPIGAMGRVQYHKARALLRIGQLDAAEALLLNGMALDDVREGEVSLSELWFTLQTQRIALRESIPITPEMRERVRNECPPPASLDFRMR